jgi:phage FluMu protein Com
MGRAGSATEPTLPIFPLFNLRRKEMFTKAAKADPYSDDGPFMDPVVRCDRCRKLVLRLTLAEKGKCPHCGAIKVWKIQNFTAKEKAWMEEVGVDPAFLALFECKEIGGAYASYPC